MGKWFRNRYDKLLSKKYEKKEILVQSSDSGRCLRSASANLAGLYKPTKEDMWMKDLPWDPVPIHTRPEEDDPYLAMTKPCPRHKKLVEELKQNNEYFKNLPVQFHEEFEIVAKNTGWNVTIDNFEGLYTTFYVYAMHNESFLPPWANSLNKKKFTFLAGLSFASQVYTDPLKTLKAGPFFRNLIQFFDTAMNSTTDATKFLMLSGHDTTLVVALHSMGVYDFKPPEFTSTIIWELYKDLTGSHFMKIFYKRPSTEQVEELIMPSCNQPCYFNNFSNYVGQYVRDEKTWETICELNH